MGTGRVGLKIDFNFFNFAQTFRGFKKLNLNNGFSDPTLIRETIAYELFEQMDIPTPRTAFADVWVNDTHLGLYTMVEQVDKTFLRRHFANPDGNLYKPEERPAALDWTKDDLNEQATQMSQPPDGQKKDNLDIKIGGSSLGDLFAVFEREVTSTSPTSKILPDETASSLPRQPGRPFPGRPEGPFPGEPNRPFTEGPGMRFPGGPGRPFRPSPPAGRNGGFLGIMGLKTNENYPDHSALLHLLEVLNKCPDDSFTSEIEKVLDVDGVLRFLAVSALIVHLDNYIGSGHNYYLYEANGKFSLIPWDLNMAFGTFNEGLDREGLVNFYIDEPTIGPIAGRPLVARLLGHKSYLETYHQYIEQLLNSGFAEGVIESRIDEVVKMIRPFVESDDLKFYSTEDFERSMDEDSPVGQGRHRGPMMGPPRGGPKSLGLKSFIKDRRLSVRQQLGGNLASRGDGRGNRGDTDILDRFRDIIDRFRRERRESR